jgi:hypothetical protein
LAAGRTREVRRAAAALSAASIISAGLAGAVRCALACARRVTEFVVSALATVSAAAIIAAALIRTVRCAAADAVGAGAVGPALATLTAASIVSALDSDAGGDAVIALAAWVTVLIFGALAAGAAAAVVAAGLALTGGHAATGAVGHARDVVSVTAVTARASTAVIAALFAVAIWGAFAGAGVSAVLIDSADPAGAAAAVIAAALARTVGYTGAGLAVLGRRSTSGVCACVLVGVRGPGICPCRVRSGGPSRFRVGALGRVAAWVRVRDVVRAGAGLGGARCSSHREAADSESGGQVTKES